MHRHQRAPEGVSRRPRGDEQSPRLTLPLGAGWIASAHVVEIS